MSTQDTTLPLHAPERTDKLRGGYVPSSAESFELHGIARRARDEAKRLEDLARAELERLNARIAILERCAQECEALTSPIRRVPPEIMANIFSLAEPTLLIGRLRCPTMNLGKVCKVWWDIISTTPGLKLSLCVPIPGETEEVRRKADSLQLFLKQRPHMAMDLRIDRTDEDDSPFIEELLHYADRWQRLSIDLSSEDALKCIRPKTFSNMNFLSCTNVEPFLWYNFPQMPRLSRVSVDFSRRCLISPDHLALPWKQLTSLEVIGPPALIAGLLEHCAALKHFTMNILELSYLPSDHPPSQMISKLDSFELSGLGTHLVDIFPRIILPRASVATLTEKMVYNVVNLRPSLLSLLAQAPALVELNLTSKSITDDDLIECLRVTRALERLLIKEPFQSHLRISLLTDKLLLGLRVGISEMSWSDILIPNLKSLKLHHRSFSQPFRSILSKVTISRSEPRSLWGGTVAHLQHVFLYTEDSLPEGEDFLKSTQT